MKIWTWIDLFIQTLVVGTGAIAILFFLLTGRMENDRVLAIFLGALFLGSWQLFSSTIGAIRRHPFLQLRWIHLVGSGSYVLSAYVLSTPMAERVRSTDLFDRYARIIAIGIPAILAVFCYYVTFITFLRYYNISTLSQFNEEFF